MNEGSWLHSRRMLAIVACMAVLYMLIMGNLLFVNGRTPGVNYQYNLVPLETIKPLLFERDRYHTEAWVKNLFGNIVLFIPLGIWIPWLFRRCRKFWPFTGVVVLLLFAVEVTQLITRLGSFDVDDIMLNTVGAWIGYIGFALFLYSQGKTRD
ncbi:VanZ family protein [Paenibacillus sp. UMB7766-LJ446]|uniref:VanZ family protein n=1 Tax=Paenibacillus sp. UMB7766-LJ446 TaxID=3046313 RepID=UPI00254BB6D5|nr:VanZ family protein [Paenibacillus sp. UMB7766-LJ446]MDK8190741.1 VanZ family protein [Paenibacillus sp. UMB7766-LJ446]